MVWLLIENIETSIYLVILIEALTAWKWDSSDMIYLCIFHWIL